MKFASSYLFLLLLFLSAVCGTPNFDLKRCRNSLLNVTKMDGVMDFNGTRTGYSYARCLDECGQGVDASDFPTVVQQLTLWFLPYLTLLAQVPVQTEDTIA